MRRYLAALILFSMLPVAYGQQEYARTSVEVAAGVTPVNYGYPVGYVDRYATNTNRGTTVMLTAIKDAFNVVMHEGGGAVTFLPETYYLGSYGNNVSQLVELHNPTNIVVYGNGATITVNTQPGGNLWSIFDLQNPVNFTVIGLNVTGTGYVEAREWQGARVWNLTATSSTDSGGISIIGGTYTNLVAPVFAYWTPGTTGRIRHIFLQYRAVNCFYGASFADQGDYVSGAITSINPRRAYYIYGVSGHNITVNTYWDGTTNAGGSTGVVYFKRYEFDTLSDTVRAIFHGSGTYAGSPIHIETEGRKGTLGITALGMVVGGSFYRNGVYLNVPLTGGSGIGATASIKVAGGAVVSVAIQNPGRGYASGDMVSASASSVGGTGSGFSVAVSGVGATVAHIRVDLSMADYSPANAFAQILIDSRNSAGTIQSTTYDRLTDITLDGDFGQWTSFSGYPIEVQSMQNLPAHLILDGPLLGTLTATRQLSAPLPGFITTHGTKILGEYAVSSLNTSVPCSSNWNGYTASVSDAKSPTYNGTLTGGGSANVPVYCNGSKWTSH